MRIYEKNRDPYEGGLLHQICSKCQWWQSGHGVELSHCPLCGEAVDALVGLLFGGTMVVFDGVRFFFHDRSGNQVVVDRADYPDVITFMLRHALVGPIVGNIGHLRRIRSGDGDYHEKHPNLAFTKLHKFYQQRSKCAREESEKAARQHHGSRHSGENAIE